MQDIKLLFLLSHILSFLLFIRAGFVQLCCAMRYFKYITYSRCQNDSNKKGTSLVCKEIRFRDRIPMVINNICILKKGVLSMSWEVTRIKGGRRELFLFLIVCSALICFGSRSNHAFCYWLDAPSKQYNIKIYWSHIINVFIL